MTRRQQAIDAYSALAPNKQAIFLAELAFETTVWARGSYLLLTGDDHASAELLTRYNELQHKITAHLMHLLNGNALRYPDEVFVNILFDMSGVANCQDKLSRMFQDLHRAYLNTRKNT
jgi:hypothetical protein